MTKREHWFSLVAEQQQSSDSIVAFCASKDIKLNTFHYWRRKYKQSGREQTGSFVTISRPVSGGSAIRIAYPNGVDIHLSVTDLSLIAALLRLG